MLLSTNISIVLKRSFCDCFLWFFCSKEAVLKPAGDWCSSFPAAPPNGSAADTTNVFSFEGLSLQIHFKGPHLTIICFVAALTQQQLLRLAFPQTGTGSCPWSISVISLPINLLCRWFCSFQTDAHSCGPLVAAALHVSPNDWQRGSVCGAAPRTRSNLLPAN